VGAWVETSVYTPSALIKESHLTWVRGLKPELTFDDILDAKSHLTWVRGLKQL